MTEEERALIPETVGPYRITYLFGRGSFSNVYQGVDITNNKKVALKFINRDILRDKNTLALIEREVRMSERIFHKNIIRYEHIYFLKDFIVLAMECLTNGTILTTRENALFQLQDSVYLKWGKDILEGLQYLHKKGIAHHDIKPDNIGLDNYMNAKILDLGLCEEFKDFCYEKSGTLLFAAPEILWSNAYDGKKADVWSFGVTFHYLVAGVLPFKDTTIYEKQFNKIEIENNIINRCPEPLKEIVDKALVFDPAKRSSVEDILSLKIFNQARKDEVSSISDDTHSTAIRRRTVKNIIITPILKNKMKFRKRGSQIVFRQRNNLGVLI